MSKEPDISETLQGGEQRPDDAEFILKFSHFYDKFPFKRRCVDGVQTEFGVLLGAFQTHYDNLSLELIGRDTAYLEKGQKQYYQLQKKHLILLIVSVDGAGMFTTIRPRYYTDPKTRIVFDNTSYYLNRVGKKCRILINCH